MRTKDEVVQIILEHLQDISAGQCFITDEYILSEPDQEVQEILTGLLYLHEDLVFRANENERSRIALKEANERLEERVEARTLELTTANEEIKQFAYIVSHDLRAPLVNLKGFVSELRMSLDTVLSAMEPLLPNFSDTQQEDLVYALEEDIPESLEFLESSAQRMDNLVNSLLKLSRLGRRELNLETLNMNELVHETLNTLSYQIEQKQVVVDVDELPNVVADRTVIEQVMSNILINAVNYLDSGRTGRIHIEGKTFPQKTLFSIRDNGIGIAEEDMKKVFAPFRRIGRPSTPGEGMGLAYVQTMVRNHGGHIWCESELGSGTTFSFFIPNKARK